MLSDLAISAHDRSSCQRAGVYDAASILRTPTAELRRWLPASDAKGDAAVTRVKQAAAVAQAPRMVSALERWREAQQRGCMTYTTGDSALDAILGGGIHAGALTEVVGQSATGKTQLALQTAVYAALALDADVDGTWDVRDSDDDDLVHALQGYGVRPAHQRRSVLFIVFDGKGELGMVARRMEQVCASLIQARWRRADQHRRLQARQDGQTKRRRTEGAFASSENARVSLADLIRLAQEELMRNVHFAAMTAFGMLQHALQYDLPAMRTESRRPIGLVILDDITDCIHEAAERRAARSSETTVERSRVCAELSDQLKMIAATGDTAAPPAILVTNHVVDVLDQQKDMLRPTLESIIDGGTNAVSRPSQKPPSGVDEDLAMNVQEPRFTGMTAHLQLDAIGELARSVGPDVSRAQLLDSILSGLRSASLGLSWVNCINVRLVLTHTIREVTLPRQQHKELRDAGMRGGHRFGVRRAVNVLNPFAKTMEHVEYIINADGIRSLRHLGLQAVKHMPDDAVRPAPLPDDDLLWHSVGEDTLAEEEISWLSQMEASQSASAPASM